MVEVAQMPSAHLSHMEAVEGAAETMRVLAKQVEALSSQVLVLPSRMSCILDEAMQRSSDLIKEEIRTAIEKQNTFQQAAIARLHSDTVRASVEALRCQTEEDESHPAKGVQQIVQRIEAKEFLHQMRDIVDKNGKDLEAMAAPLLETCKVRALDAATESCVNKLDEILASCTPSSFAPDAKAAPKKTPRGLSRGAKGAAGAACAASYYVATPPDSLRTSQVPEIEIAANWLPGGLPELYPHASQAAESAEWSAPETPSEPCAKEHCAAEQAQGDSPQATQRLTPGRSAATPGRRPVELSGRALGLSHALKTARGSEPNGESSSRRAAVRRQSDQTLSEDGSSVSGSWKDLHGWAVAMQQSEAGKSGAEQDTGSVPCAMKREGRGRGVSEVGVAEVLELLSRVPSKDMV